MTIRVEDFAGETKIQGYGYQKSKIQAGSFISSLGSEKWGVDNVLEVLFSGWKTMKDEVVQPLLLCVGPEAD